MQILFFLFQYHTIPVLRMTNSMQAEPSPSSLFRGNLFSQVQPYQVAVPRSVPSLFGGSIKPVGVPFRPESASTQSGSAQMYVDPIMEAIYSLADQMKSMSAVLRDVHDISNQHSVTLRDHANSINMINVGETKNSSAYLDRSLHRQVPAASQASTRETTPLSRPTYPNSGQMPGRIASSIPQTSFPITVPQPYRYTPPVIQYEEPVSQPPVPTLAALSPRSPNTTARTIQSVRTPGGRPRRPSMAEAANIRAVSNTSRSAAAASRGRLVKQQVAPSVKPSKPLPPRNTSGRLNIPTVSSENRIKSPARVSGQRTPTAVTLRSVTPSKITKIGEASPHSYSRPAVPLIRYELQVSYNGHVVAKAQLQSAVSEDGPFLYVIQSELDPALTFIPHPEMPCSFTGLSISVLATNTRTRRTNIVFQSHSSHVDNPPVNEDDGYFSHSCWLSGPSASVVGGVRMFFKRQEDGSITIYAMSLKFWFPESVGNGLAQAPPFTRDHFKELLRLLGILPQNNP
jgi:hypothetical protein